MDEQNPSKSPENDAKASPEAALSKTTKPSFIPEKASLEYPRKPSMALSLEHIEGVHIAIFIGLLAFIFIGVWKRPNHR